MRKLTLFSSLFLMITLCGCNNDEYASDSGNTPSLTTEAKFVRLSDNNSEVAGELVITSVAKTVEVKWNTEEICNLNTEQTVVEMKNGKGVLPVKWQKRLPKGSYGPEETAYKAGVLLTAGETSRYVPLVWANQVDSTKIESSIPTTRSAGDIMPRVAQITMTPTTVNMNYATGGVMYVSLIDIPFAIFDLSEFISDMNVDMAQIPNMITASQAINFRWTAAGPPDQEFSAQLIAFGEGITQIGKVTYSPETPTASLVYSTSNLPAENIPQTGGAYTFTFTGNYTGGVQVRALANGVVVATGTSVTNKQPTVTVTANNTGATRNITFQYKRADGNWTNLPAETNRVQNATGGGGDITGGIPVAGYTWAPGNLRKNGYVFTFHDNQEGYSGAWDGADYWNWNVLDVYTYSTVIATWDDANDPCRQVAPAGTWRTPTSAQMQALANTQNSWGYKNGVLGRYFGPDNALFLPAAGWRPGSASMSNTGYASLYWTRTPSENNQAYALGVQNDNVRVDAYISRNMGLPIRCVKE